MRLRRRLPPAAACGPARQAASGLYLRVLDLSGRHGGGCGRGCREAGDRLGQLAAVLERELLLVDRGCLKRRSELTAGAIGICNWTSDLLRSRTQHGRA
jgi:hypothetical protein